MGIESEFDDISRAYKRIFKSYFPSIYIRLYIHNGQKLIEAFNVSNNTAFTLFVLNELPIILAKEGIPLIGILPYNMANTRKYFPELLSGEH